MSESQIAAIIGLNFGQRLIARDLAVTLVKWLELESVRTGFAEKLVEKLNGALETGMKLIPFSFWELLALRDLSVNYRDHAHDVMEKQKTEGLYVAAIAQYIFAHRLWECFHQFDSSKDGHFVNLSGGHDCGAALSRLQDHVIMYQLAFGE